MPQAEGESYLYPSQRVKVQILPQWESSIPFNLKDAISQQ
jgi:hypothetical protein